MFAPSPLAPSFLTIKHKHINPNFQLLAHIRTRVIVHSIVVVVVVDIP